MKWFLREKGQLEFARRKASREHLCSPFPLSTSVKLDAPYSAGGDFERKTGKPELSAVG